MHSLTAQALGPATTQFLDAVDQHLNSTTLFLVIANNDSLDDQDQLQVFLTNWLRSTLFSDMVLEAATLRGWHNLTPNRIGHFSGQVALQPLSLASFLAHLWWMLHEGPSPYGPVLVRQQAAQLLEDFGRELFGTPSWDSVETNQLPALKDTIQQYYRFYAMPPNQLASTISGYFYNLHADSITVIVYEEIVYLILTNGSD